MPKTAALRTVVFEIAAKKLGGCPLSNPPPRLGAGLDCAYISASILPFSSRGRFPPWWSSPQMRWSWAKDQGVDRLMQEWSEIIRIKMSWLVMWLPNSSQLTSICFVIAWINRKRRQLSELYGHLMSSNIMVISGKKMHLKLQLSNSVTHA